MTTSQPLASCSLPCNLCGSTQVAELSHLDRDGSALRTVICKDCGLVWSDPLPMDVAQYYEHDYRLDYKAAYTPKPVIPA